MISGYVRPGFEQVRAVFEENFKGGLELGAGFAAIQDGEILVNLSGGFRDKKRDHAWNEATMVALFSTTKPISALVVGHVISTSKNVSYDTLMKDIWPEFSVNGKGLLTIGDVLSHQGGLSGIVEPMDAGLWFDPPAIIEKLAAAKPLWDPVPDGTSGYHPLSWGYLVTEIVRRLSGKSVGEVLADVFTGTHSEFPEIDLRIGTPASEHDRCADIQRPRQMPDLGPMNAAKKAAFMTKWAAPDRGGATWKEIEIPSANGIGTALAVAQIYAVYANAGRLDGEEIIDPETWTALTKCRTRGPDRVLPYDLEFAAGVMRNNNLFYGKNPNAFGHAGWGGSAAFGDPDSRLSGAYVMNAQSNKLMGDPRATALFDAVYDCL